jgi:hypothetical protein
VFGRGKTAAHSPRGGSFFSASDLHTARLVAGCCSSLGALDSNAGVAAAQDALVLTCLALRKPELMLSRSSLQMMLCAIYAACKLRGLVGGSVAAVTAAHSLPLAGRRSSRSRR